MANPLEIWRRSLSSPFREMDRMQSAFDQMFENLPEFRKGGMDFRPSCEVTEDASHYLLKFDLPGVPKDQVKIELNDNQLTVSAERREEKKTDNKKTHFSEINYGSYTRSFTLPGSIDAQKVDAKFDNGVLFISVPKSEANKAKKIEIQ